MTHIFTVTQPEFDNLHLQRHLVVKDSAKIATDDTALVQTDGEHREELIFKIISVEHGAKSKHINGYYCLLGLFAPYATAGEMHSINSAKGGLDMIGI